MGHMGHMSAHCLEKEKRMKWKAHIFVNPYFFKMINQLELLIESLI